MFNAFFDVHGGDGVVEKADIEEVLEKLRKYCGYLKSDPKYMQMNDVMFAFYNSMVDQVRKEKMCSGEAEGFKTVKILILNFKGPIVYFIEGRSLSRYKWRFYI